MAPGGSKIRRSRKKNILYDDDIDAQYEVAYRREKVKLKSGVRKTTLVAESLLEDPAPPARNETTVAAMAPADSAMPGVQEDWAEFGAATGHRPRKASINIHIWASTDC